MAGRRMFAEDDEPESNWISVSDLMAGLMMVFLLILIVYHVKPPPPPPEPPRPPIGSEGGEEKGKISGDALAADCDLSSVLDTEFGEAGEKPGFTVVHGRVVQGREEAKCSLTIGGEDTVLFDTGEATLRPRDDKKDIPSAKEVLNEFFPRYIALIYSNEGFRDYVSEVRIEGHTSSEWKDLPVRKAFVENMRLSQGRAQSVFDHVMGDEMLEAVVDAVQRAEENSGYSSLARGDLRQDMEKWLVENVSANGFSSRHLVLDSEEEEDRGQSRRVEFTLETRGKELLLEELLNATGSQDEGE